MKVADFLNLPDVAVDVVVTDKQELLEKLAVRAGARVGLQPEVAMSFADRFARTGDWGSGLSARSEPSVKGALAENFHGAAKEKLTKKKGTVPEPADTRAAKAGH
jgi:hypothetical protein